MFQQGSGFFQCHNLLAGECEGIEVKCGLHQRLTWTVLYAHEEYRTLLCAREGSPNEGRKKDK